MTDLTPDMVRTLGSLVRMGGTGPDRPYMREPGPELMRRGLIELVRPEPPLLPYARITAAGREAARRARTP